VALKYFPDGEPNGCIRTLDPADRSSRASLREIASGGAIAKLAALHAEAEETARLAIFSDAAFMPPSRCPLSRY